MTSERWAVSDVDDYDQNTAGHPLPSLVSLHFVRSALRRRWWICVLFALLGLLMAIAYLLSSSASHVAKAALVLAHDPQVDSSRAMSTDVSLLMTRTVANETIASLRLDMTPDEFRQSVTADPVSSELLSLTLTAPSDAEAVRRLEALTSIYLNFRAEQLSAQSNILVDGMRQRIQQLQVEMAQRSKEIDQLANAKNAGGTKLSDTIAQRAYVQQQIETLQQSIQDATLRNASVVSSSRVVDPAAVDTAGVKRRAALTLASGLIGGAALGCGIVLFFAITSDRLRRRSDVAAALEAPLISVGRIAPVSKRWVWLPHLHELDSHRTDERQRLVRAISKELPSPHRSGRLAVACVDNADETRFAVVTAAADLLAEGRTVALIDLSEQGSLVEVVRSVPDSAAALTVLRPRGVPALAVSPADLSAIGHENGSSPLLETSDVSLVFADLDPSVGADHLAAWTERVIVAVTAGRSSAERVRTVAELIRTAGLDLRLAALLHTERTDSSSAASFDRRAAVQLRDTRDQPLLESQMSVDHLQEVAAGTTAALVATDADSPVATEEAQVLAAERPAAEEAEAPLDDETVPGEQAAADEQAKPEEQQLAAEEQVGAVVEPAVVEPAVEEGSAGESTTEEQVAALEEETEGETSSEEQAIAEEQSAPDARPIGVVQMADVAKVEEPLVAGEQACEEHAAADEQAMPEEQRLAAEEQVAAVVEPAVEEPAAEERSAGESTTEEHVAAVEEETEGETSSEEQAIAEEQSAPEARPVGVVQMAEVAKAAADPYVIDEEPSEETVAVEEPLVAREQAHEEHAHAAEQPTDGQEVAGEEVAAEELSADEYAEGETASEVQPVPEAPPGAAEVAAAEPAADQETIDKQPAEERAVDEPTVVGEQIPDEKQQVTTDEQPPPDEHLTVEEEVAAVEEHTADELEAIDEERAEEQSAEHAAEEETNLEDQAATSEQAPEEQPTDEQPAATEQETDDEEAIEPDELTELLEEGTVDGWNLYIVRYPPADGAPTFNPEDEEFDWNWDWDGLDDVRSKRVPAVADHSATHDPGNRSMPQANAEADARVGADLSGGNGKKSTTVARARNRSRTRRRNRHK